MTRGALEGGWETKSKGVRYTFAMLDDPWRAFLRVGHRLILNRPNFGLQSHGCARRAIACCVDGGHVKEQEGVCAGGLWWRQEEFMIGTNTLLLSIPIPLPLWQDQNLLLPPHLSICYRYAVLYCSLSLSTIPPDFLSDTPFHIHHPILLVSLSFSQGLLSVYVNGGWINIIDKSMHRCVLLSFAYLWQHFPSLFSWLFILFLISFCSPPILFIQAYRIDSINLMMKQVPESCSPTTSTSLLLLYQFSFLLLFVGLMYISR